MALGQNAFDQPKPGVKIEEYAETFLGRIQHTRKYSTWIDYQKILKHDLLPVFRGLDLQAISREKVKALAVTCLQKGQSPKTVQNIVCALSSLLSHAVEDDLIAVNPALRPGRFLPKISKRRSIDPLTREELARLLAVAKVEAPALYPLYLCAARTGLRQGELLALQWEDINFAGRFIEVRHNMARGTLTTPKSGESRRVDMSQELTDTLQGLELERQLEALMRKGQQLAPWVFRDANGQQWHHNFIRSSSSGCSNEQGSGKCGFTISGTVLRRSFCRTTNRWRM